jgi:WD40 repeat protein
LASTHIDQKKDIVSLFPDIAKPFLIHSCSMDRSISTYDLKQEKRINGHQTKNGALFGMTQRTDSEMELVTCGQGSPIYFWDCDQQTPVAEIMYPYKVLTIQVSPSSRFLAFGTETNEVFVYSINGLNSFTFMGKGLGHSGPVTKLKWSPDEK